ncbi:MAG: hypothetical protein ABGZ53_33640 [Fuerstiella sp.]
MKQKRHTVDQMIAKLRRADVLLGKGTKVPEVSKELGITEQTCVPLTTLGRVEFAEVDVTTIDDRASLS